MNEVNREEEIKVLLARLDELAMERAALVEFLCKRYGLPERTIPKKGLYARLFLFDEPFAAHERAIREAWVRLLRLERPDMALIVEGQEGALGEVEE